MEGERQGLVDLPYEELERRAQEHVEGIFREMQALGAKLREDYHPLKVAQRHPVATAAVAGLLLARLVLGRRRGPAPAPGDAAARKESLGRTFSRSLLAGIAGSAGQVLSGMALAWVVRRTRSSQTGADTS